MVKRVLLLGAAILWPALGQAAVITESDTGIVFAERNCVIESAELVDVQFKPGTFDYLDAVVTWDYTCRRRPGRLWKYRTTRRVSFPGLDYDWVDQVWMWGDTPVAELKSFQKAELMGDFFHTMWSSIDEGVAISFRVQIERP